MLTKLLFALEIKFVFALAVLCSVIKHLGSG